MNNDRILEKVKMKIAISQVVKEEDLAMKKNKKSIGKSIGIAACVLLSTTGIAFATTKLINKFGANSSGGVQTAVENNYVSEVNTEYKIFNNIGASIESFLIDDNNFDLTINLKFDEKIKIDEDLKYDIMDLKVVNEKGEKVFATHELELEEIKKLNYTEQEAKEKYDYYDGSYSGIAEKISDNELKYYLTATGASNGFPASKKLNVTFNKIRRRYFVGTEEKYTIYEGEWNYEIDVPTKMSKSNIVNYKLVSISDKNYKFDGAILSNTAFKIYLSNCDGIAWNDNECIETSDGTKYYPTHRSDGDGEISVKSDDTTTYYNTFDLTNYNTSDNLKVHLFKSNGEEVIIKLVKEK